MHCDSSLEEKKINKTPNNVSFTFFERRGVGEVREICVTCGLYGEFAVIGWKLLNFEEVHTYIYVSIGDSTLNNR